jgi:hypothetical protein
MYVLTSSPYSLAQGTLIQATVTATNAIGTSIQSSLNTAG